MSYQEEAPTIEELLSSNPIAVGHAIDKFLSEQRLIHFIECMWQFVEPGREFVQGWILDAICEHLEAVTSGEIKRLVINVPPGMMKPASIDCLVLEETKGRIRLGDVVVGDKVLTHKGRYRSVTDVYEQGTLPLLRVTTKNGRWLETAPDHPYLTPRGWIQAKDLTVDDTVANVFPQESSMAPDLMAPEEARFLGYMVGDGSCKYKDITFTNGDEAVLEDFEHCAQFLGFRTVMKKKNPAHDFWTLGVRNPETYFRTTKKGAKGPVQAYMEKCGLQGKDSYTKTVPSSIFQSSDSIISEFIGAYWSCDGFVHQKGFKISGELRPDIVVGCDTVSHDLAAGLQHLLLRLGVNAKLRRREHARESIAQPGGRYVHWALQLTAFDQVAAFAAKIPVAHFDKAQKLSTIKPISFPKILDEDPILKIEEVGHGECRCLSVKDDKSFTANDIVIHNSLTTNCFYPAWEWGPCRQPVERYLCASYSQSLTIRDNVRFRQVISSDLYRALWGDVFGQSKEQFNLIKVGNNRAGWKIATSTSGVGTGERASRVLIDDANSVAESESAAILESTKRWFLEVIPSRLQDLRTDAIVVIQQRTSEKDVTGVIFEQELDYDALIIPMYYESDRHCSTSIGWQDPRGLDDLGIPLEGEALERADGALAFPERFPLKEVKALERTMGPAAASGQLQQRPTPRGGGIFKREWWEAFPPSDWPAPEMGKLIPFPKFSYICAGLDTALTEKQENDYSALSVFGVWHSRANPNITPRIITDPNGMLVMTDDDQPKAMLIDVWQKRLPLHGPPEYKPEHMTAKQWDSPLMMAERQKNWGLVEWVIQTCKKHKVDMLLIEDKAAGHTVHQELARLYANQNWGVQLVDPRNQDKVARAYSIQHLFSNGIIYAPQKYDHELRQWRFLQFVEDLITEMEHFPKASHDDRTDAVVYTLRHMRDVGVLLRRDEAEQAWEDDNAYTRRKTALYDI